LASQLGSAASLEVEPESEAEQARQRRAEMSAGLVTDEATVGRLYRIRCTVMQKLRDRGYLVVEHELATSRFNFLRKFGESFHREDLQINKSKKNDPSDQVSPRLQAQLCLVLNSRSNPNSLRRGSTARLPCFMPLLIGSDGADVCG